MRVTVFGGSSPKPGSFEYQQAYQLGQLLGKWKGQPRVSVRGRRGGGYRPGRRNSIPPKTLE